MQPTPDVFGPLAGGAVVFLAVCAFAAFMVLVGYPLLAIMAVRALVRIARAVESISVSIGATSAGAPTGAFPYWRQPASDPAGDVPIARPGDLGLSRK